MYILGLDIGGTKCAAVTGNWDGENITILDKRMVATRHDIGAVRMLSILFDLADEILTGVPDAIGISCGGPLDSARGVVMSPPNLPGWDNIEIVRMAEKRFNAPAYLQNDANASAVAEWKFGAGRGLSNLVFLTFGTGLGAGLILNGALYEGTNGNAGEVGHIRLENDGPVGFGKAGSFEGFCSGGGIAKLGIQMARESVKAGKCPAYLTDGEVGVSARSIAEAARMGDEVACEVYRTAGRELGRGLAIIIDTLNPERIIIGGVYQRSGDLLWESAKAELDAEALAEAGKCCAVVAGELGEAIGDYAALAVAVYAHPLDEGSELIKRYPALSECEADINTARDLLISCFAGGGKLMLAGNGGSCADCEHIAGELMKGFLLKRPLDGKTRAAMKDRFPAVEDAILDRLQGGLPAIPLTSFTALNTAFANDADAELVYAQSVLALGKENDVLLAISTSGNSKNVVAAAKVARAIGVKVIALTGCGGGMLRKIADASICVPEAETYKIQELHLPIYHHLAAEIERHFFG